MYQRGMHAPRLPCLQLEQSSRRLLHRDRADTTNGTRFHRRRCSSARRVLKLCWPIECPFSISLVNSTVSDSCAGISPDDATYAIGIFSRIRRRIQRIVQDNPTSALPMCTSARRGDGRQATAAAPPGILHNTDDGQLVSLPDIYICS